MRAVLLAATALAFTTAAHAGIPTCTNTIDLGDIGGTVSGSTLLTPGTCVHAGDKTFGDFTSTGPGTASGTFTPASHFGNVTLGLAGAITTVATVTYDIVVDAAAIALGWRIDDFTKDLTLNQARSTGVPALATLDGHSPEGLFQDFSCQRTDPASALDSCPVHIFFGPVTDVTLQQTVTAGANTVITGLTDTVSQVNVPEPLSLAVLGSGLLGLAMVRRRAGQGRRSVPITQQSVYTKAYGPRGKTAALANCCKAALRQQH